MAMNNMHLPGTVTEIETLQAFERVTQKDDTLAVTFFWADFHAPSCAGGQVAVMYTQLAMLQPKLKFLKVDADKAQDLAEKFDISIVPTFLFTQGSTVLDTLEGANVSELATRVNVLSKSSVRKANTAAAPAAPTAVSSTDAAMLARLQKLTTSASIMLFMKGSPTEPKCGFSRKMVDLLTSQQIRFSSFDILSDNDVRQALKSFSNWPTFPQLYVHGKLVGGLDILTEMVAEGEPSLQTQFATTTGSTSTSPTDDPADPTLHQRLAELVQSAPVLLCMKGSPAVPQCGFSRTIVNLLREHQIGFATFDILSDNDVRQGLKEFSNWPTFPQLYVNGKLVGGLDIVSEMAEDGDLATQLGVAKKQAKTTPDLQALVSRAPVMVFMKGSPAEPQCGFSKTLIGILEAENFVYDHFDILTNDAVRQGLKAFSNWPTFPQLYIRGELIGGLDIVKELQEEGELASLKDDAQ